MANTMLVLVICLVCTINASTSVENNELATQEDVDILTVLKRVAELEAKLEKQNNDIRESAEVKGLKAEISLMKAEMENLKAAPRRSKRSSERGVKPVAASYIRWGRNGCEGDSITVYRGHAAGPHYGEASGGSNFLCLHEQPQWKKIFPGNTGWYGTIYGIEYEVLPENNVFSSTNNGGHSPYNYPAPCAACYVPNRTTVMMIPARTECPSGWTKEYQGYIVSEYFGSGRPRSQYTCFDESPESAIGGTHLDQSVIYPTQVVCGSLPCSRFVTGWELTCVVCSM